MLSIMGSYKYHKEKERRKNKTCKQVIAGRTKSCDSFLSKKQTSRCYISHSAVPFVAKRQLRYSHVGNTVSTTFHVLCCRGLL